MMKGRSSQPLLVSQQVLLASISNRRSSCLKLGNHSLIEEMVQEILCLSCDLACLPSQSSYVMVVRRLLREMLL